MDITIRILEGKGPKLNNIISVAYLITKDNLDWAAQSSPSRRCAKSRLTPRADVLASWR